MTIEVGTTVSRAKFRCTSMKVTEYNASAREYAFNAVCQDETEENKRYHRYSPSGSLTILVDNENVKFELGESYYLDFIKAPK
jgi:hypothetical protein